jgi:hypothetical protein|tara:strand:+ start:238 stop:1488 length:1251 start_codon:yes stop_codon:yes gene_type:complete
MARQDIAGLLTGVSSGGIDPVTAGNSEQQRLAFGAQRAEGLGRASRGLMGGNSMTAGEQLQIAMASLDLSKPEDLRKLAGIQQATGDLTGAAKTAAGIRELELEGKTRTAVSNRLIELGRTSEAQQILDRTMSTSVGQSLVLQLDRDKRAAESKAAADQATVEGDRVGLLNAMSVAGISKDSAGYKAAQNGSFDNTSAAQLTSVINTLKRTENPEIKVTNLAPYQTSDGIVMAGQYTIDQGGGNVQRTFGYETEEGIMSIDLDNSSKVADKKLEGIKVSPTQVKNIMLRLSTAGELGATDGKNKPIEGFLTDANDAWTRLDEVTQYEIGMAVAVRAEQYRKDQNMDQLKAETKAIKEIFTKNVEKDPDMFDFDFNDTLLNRSKVDSAIAKGPEQQLKAGTYTVTLANGKTIQVERE